MTNIGKIVLGAAVLIGLVVGPGCGSNPQPREPVRANGLTGLSLEIPKVVAEGRQKGQFWTKKNGFWIPREKIIRSTGMNLRTIAGILQETIKVKGNDGNYILEGSYSEFLHPEAYEKAMKRSDYNGDGAIIRQESERSLIEVLEAYANR